MAISNIDTWHDRMSGRLRADPGRLHVIVGRSGSGKSTLLRHLAALEPDSCVLQSIEDVVRDVLARCHGDLRPPLAPGCLWIVDDVDLVGSKPRTALELARSMARHLAGGGRVVCAALAGRRETREILRVLRRLAPVRVHRAATLPSCDGLSRAGAHVRAVGAVGRASGAGAAERASTAAILACAAVHGARIDATAVTIGIVGGRALKLVEVRDAVRAVTSTCHEDCELTVACTMDPAMDESVTVTVTAALRGRRAPPRTPGSAS